MRAAIKTCGHDNRWLDCFQIWQCCSVGISDELINYWDKSVKKMAATAEETSHQRPFSKMAT